MCSITHFGNTVLKYLPVDNVGESDLLNHSHEFGETSGAGAIVAVIKEIAGNVGKTNLFHDSPPDKSWKMLVLPISNNFQEFGKTSGAGTMEIVRIVGKTSIFHDSPQTKSWTGLVLPTCSTISMNMEKTSGAKTIVNPELRNIH